MRPDLAMWGLIVGSVLPPFIAVVQRSPSPAVRSATMIVCCLVAGLVTIGLAEGWEYLWSGEAFSSLNLWSTLTAVVVGAHSFYKAAWRPVGIAPALERSTGTRNRTFIPSRAATESTYVERH